MNEERWRAERDDRTLRYAGRVLSPTRRILLRVEPAYVQRYDGQVAFLVAANLLGRMSPSVWLDVPRVRMLAPLPWAGQDLADHALAQLRAADPYGRFEVHSASSGDYIIHLGASGAETVAYGSGWNAYVGSAPAKIPQSDSCNPIGPAFAAILPIARMFVHDLKQVPFERTFNLFAWTHAPSTDEECPFPPPPNLGEIWSIGAGSVGTAILYFLSLATRSFAVTLFDHDIVKRQNLDRSPIFVDKDVGAKKVHATAEYLHSVGAESVIVEPYALHESGLWRTRQAGTPDVLVSAANEFNVRSLIEVGFPPIQIYGTTGRNWQAASLRHIPLVDPCSCCLFPSTAFTPTECATGSVERVGTQETTDAALPFLSFAAGLMSAAELLKMPMHGYPFSSNRVLFNSLPEPRFLAVPMSPVDKCMCTVRSTSVHAQMIAGSRYTYLSGK